MLSKFVCKEAKTGKLKLIWMKSENKTLNHADIYS